jgi:hypothetical protein
MTVGVGYPKALEPVGLLPLKDTERCWLRGSAAV